MNQKEAYRTTLNKYKTQILQAELEFLAQMIVAGRDLLLGTFPEYPRSASVRLEIVAEVLKEREEEEGKGISDGSDTSN